MKWSHRPALDGVRALAIYLVLFFHSGMLAFDGGFVGVDLFFVLSGFLVTSVLFSEIDATGSLRLGQFYARRVRRLLPAAVVVVVATGFVFVLFTSVVRRLTLVGDAQSALLYYANWHFLAKSDDYFASTLSSSPYLHFWSLAIEEQFYVVFPVVLVGLVALSRRRSWLLPAGLAALMALSVASQLYWMTADPNHAYYGTDARLYQLLAGCLLAQLFRSGWSPKRPAWSAISGVAGLVMMLVVASGLIDVSPTWRGFLATVAGGLLIVGMMGAGPATRLFSLSPVVYLGKISYGTYLWHWPVLLILEQVLDVRPVVLALLDGVLSTALAALSAELLELPIRRRKLTPGWQWPVAVVGVTVSAITAFVVMPPLLHSDRKPAVTAADPGFAITSTAHVKVPDKDWDAVSRDYGAGHTCTQPEDCYVVKNGGPTVVLVGDSHGKSVLPMFEQLARDHGFTLAANVANGCPWQAGLNNDSRPPDARQACIDSRGEWYDHVLPQLHPDLMVLVEQSYDGNDKYNMTLSRIGGSDENLEELLANTTHETLDKFHELGARSVVFQNTIKAHASPLECLAGAKYISDCMVPVPIGLDPSDSFYEAEDIARDDMWAVNINHLICPGAPLCRPILDGRVVWRDYNHLASKLLVHLKDKVWQEMSDAGAFDGLGLADSN